MSQLPTVLRILSAGAVKPGLTRVIDAFGADHGIEATVSFATAPSIRQRIGAGEACDIVIAPPAVLAQLAKSGKTPNLDSVALGRIGVGLLVREGAWLPRLSTVDEFKQALIQAESLVYNQASTGIYLETLFERLDMGRAIATKSTRYADFAQVLDHIRAGNGQELGFGATTVIIENQSRGIKFAGPLPAEVQNYTEYEAARIAAADNQAARQFVRYLSRPEIRAMLSAAGIE
jgi:molybdate transport system substrate-binding protein